MTTSPTLLGDAMRAHVRSKSVLLGQVVLVAAALIMAFIPLFNLLAFGFSFVMALLGSVVALLSSSALVGRVRASLHRPSRGLLPSSVRFLAALVGRAAAVNLALLLLPLAIIAANGLRVPNCDWLFGLHAYLLLPALSSVLASAIGVTIGLLCGPRKFLRIGLPLFCFLASAAYAIWRFYSAPPVFSYNLFAGYFPGNLYDESLSFGAPFYWARLYHVSLVAAFLAIASIWLDVPTVRLSFDPRPGEHRLAAGLTALAAGSLAALLQLNSGALGFDIDGNDIKRFLGGRYDTEHFVIYYQPGGEIERDIRIIAQDHEFRYAQAVRTLGAAPERRITSFYFADANDKHRMMGARNVYMAKPWRSEIYLNHRSFPHPILRHEITHVVAGAFGSPGFRVSAARWLGLPVLFNVGLIEGIAVAADWPNHFDKPLTPHQTVKALRELGLDPPVERLLSTGFLAVASSRSYMVAGSLVRHLLDTYGAAPLRILYRSGGNFQAAYGRTQADLVGAWSQMIDGIELPPGAAEMVRERYRRPGIFSRVCPHAIARQRHDMAEALVRGDVARAIELARQVCRQVPHEPRYRLELAGLLAAGGKSSQAGEIFRAIAGNRDDISSSIRARATWELAALVARTGELDEVEALLTSVADLPLPDREKRLLAVQLFAARHRGQAGDALRSYFWNHTPGGEIDPLVLFGRAARTVLAEPDFGLGYYLMGRNLAGRGTPDEAAHMLAMALDRGVPDLLVRREAARLMAETAYQSGNRPLVERAAAIMTEPTQPRVTQLYGADWLDRLVWKDSEWAVR
ncbi:MAG: hypothetical protein MJE77_01085 [Proteobacteria bacterium]|nr:hypothetical protein [Pseudomonadota bacterium]